MWITDLTRGMGNVRNGSTALDTEQLGCFFFRKDLYITEAGSELCFCLGPLNASITVSRKKIAFLCLDPMYVTVIK